MGKVDAQEHTSIIFLDSDETFGRWFNYARTKLIELIDNPEFKVGYSPKYLDGRPYIWKNQIEQVPHRESIISHSIIAAIY